MPINPYKDETGKPASSKVNPKTGVSDWQKRFIIDKANKIFAKQGGAGTDKGGAFVASEMKKAAAANAAAKKPKPKSKAKPKGLNDFLKKGKRPPSKNKKIPSDADVIIKGYNDKKTLSKNKKK